MKNNGEVKRDNPLCYSSANSPIEYIFILGQDIDVQLYPDINKIVEANNIACAFIFTSKIGTSKFISDIEFYKLYRQLLTQLSKDKKLSPHLQTVFFLHGNVASLIATKSKTAHTVQVQQFIEVPTYELIRTMSETLHLNADNATTHLISCYGGRTSQDLLSYLPQLSIGLITHANDDLPQLSQLGLAAIKHLLDNHRDKKPNGFMKNLVESTSRLVNPPFRTHRALLRQWAQDNFFACIYHVNQNRR